MLFLAADDMQQFQLTERMLFDNLAAGRAGVALQGLVAELAQRARDALIEGRRHLGALGDRIGPDCVFILRLIIAIYKAVLDKIETTGYDVLTQDSRLTNDEKEHIVLQVAQQAGYI